MFASQVSTSSVDKKCMVCKNRSSSVTLVNVLAKQLILQNLNT